MTDPTTGLDPSSEEATLDRQSVTGMPRWVKVFLIVGLVLVLLFVVAKFTGVGGDHGPGRHGGGGDPPSSLAEQDDGHQSPVNHGP